MIITYELEDTLNKAKGESSSVMQALQWYYDHNRKVYSDAKYRTTSTVDCRLSWLTGLPVGDIKIDESEYRRAFGENCLHGMASRMLFGFSEERFDRRKSRLWSVPRDFYNFDQELTTDLEGYGMGLMTTKHVDSYLDRWHQAVVEGWAAGIEGQYLAWEPTQNLSGRDTYHVQKVAILCALINGHKLIQQEDWDFAVGFMVWQNEIRLTFSPGRSKRISQGEFNEIIMKEMEKHTQKLIESGKDTKDAKTMMYEGKKHYFIRWKRLANNGDWHLFGLDGRKSIHALVENGKLAYKVNFVEDDKGNEKQENDPCWVRLDDGR